jgi:uncharacterized membrane protein YphA (DoxX/SURF4 family)
MKYLVIICRYLLAFLFIFSGFVKGVDPYGFAYKLADYFKAFNADFFEPLSLLLSFILCAAELFIGLILLFGVKLRLASWGALLFMLVFTPLTFILAIFNPVHDCGCFGDAIILTNWETFYKNIIFLAAAIVLFKARSSFDPRFNSFKEIFLFVLLIIVAFLPPYIGYTRLPLFDFRPYRIGVNIPESMKTPDGAPVDVFKSTLYYKKDGVTKEFDENNIPWQDSTWKFVDAKSELIRKGYTPPIENFNLTTTTSRDITDSILLYPSYYFLVIAHRIDKTNLKSVNKLNEIYFKAKSLGYGFACVTSSPQIDIDAFISKSDAAYPFLTADEIMLKTIVRSNPGLILLYKGTIIGKWHCNQLPTASYITGDLNAKQISSAIKTTNKYLVYLLFSIIGFALLITYFFKPKKEDI